MLNKWFAKNEDLSYWWDFFTLKKFSSFFGLKFGMVGANGCPQRNIRFIGTLGSCETKIGVLLKFYSRMTKNEKTKIFLKNHEQMVDATCPIYAIKPWNSV